jgi:CRP-like cAMP-binding protein
MASSVEPLEATLRRFPLFADLDDHHLKALAAGGHRRHLDRHQHLFSRGTPATGCYGVMAGMIQLSVSNPDGAVKVVEMIGRDESFGEAAMFLGRPFPVDAMALLDTDLVFVPVAALDQLLATDNAFARRMLVSLSTRLHTMVNDIEMYTLRSATQRVVGFLIGALGAQVGAHVPATVKLPATKQVVASRLGLTPETLSRVLRDLGDRGLVRVTGRAVHISDVADLANSVG